MVHRRAHHRTSYLLPVISLRALSFCLFLFPFLPFFFFQRFEEPFASWGRRVEGERKNVVVVDGSFTSEIFKRLGENSITRIDVGVIYLERHLEKCKQSKGGRIR